MTLGYPDKAHAQGGGHLRNRIDAARSPGGRRRNTALALTAIFAFVGAMLVPTLVPTAPAQAITGADFNPGYIISDSVFFSSQAMNGAQVQSFLDGKVASCRSGFVCLRGYSQTTSNIASDRYCSGYQGGGVESAATIIVKVAASCGINPRVLLVLLQKEQSLVTSTGPSSGAYSSATGAGCPDTAPCDPSIQGFFYQVYYGARSFQRYVKNNAAYNYQWGAWEDILYHPNRGCGTRSVYIQNQATAALYNYTPYTPNDAALNNLYSTGDGCSSYGNRNFWRIFTDWFGSPTTGFQSNEVSGLIKALYQDVHGRVPDEGGTATWTRALMFEGRPASYVVNGVLASTEYYLARVDASYRQVLQREPEPSGRSYWLREIETSRLRVDDLAMIHTESDEFFEVHAGGDPREFVNLVYQQLLKRPASEADRDAWVSVMNARGRVAVVRGIYGSEESAAVRINTLYQTYFQRDADPAGIRTYTPIILSAGDHAVRGLLVNSREYLDRAVARYPE